MRRLHFSVAQGIAPSLVKPFWCIERLCNLMHEQTQNVLESNFTSLHACGHGVGIKAEPPSASRIGGLGLSQMSLYMRLWPPAFVTQARLGFQPHTRCTWWQCCAWTCTPSNYKQQEISKRSASSGCPMLVAELEAYICNH